MSKRKRFLLITALLGYLPGLLITLFALFGYDGLLRSAAQDDFLASMRTNTSLGCQTLRARAPTLLIIGDSHAYSGVDFRQLQQLLPDQRVSGCTMAGLAIDSLDLLTAYMDTNDIYPPAIVLLTSPYEFIDTPIKPTRLQQHRDILNSSSSSITTNAVQALRYLSGQPVFGTTAAHELARLNRHQPQIMRQDPKTVDALMETTRDLNSPTTSFLDLPPARTNAQVISRFCNWIKAHSITLFALHVPESPFMTRLRGNLDWYWNEMARLNTCGTTYHGPLLSRDIDPRHFINRNFSDDYDYSIWTQGTDPEKILPAFDPDHLNPLGARLFSRNLADWLSRNM